METIFKDLINTAIKPLMKESGFKKKGLTFSKSSDNLIFIVNLQKSHGNSSTELGFYVNCGVYAKEIDQTLENTINEDPKEYQCHYRARIENFSKNIDSKFIITPSTDIEKLKSQVQQAFRDMLSFYDGINNHEELISDISNKGHFESFDLFRYCIKKKLPELAQNVISHKRDHIADGRWIEKFRPHYLEILEEENVDYTFTELDVEQQTELYSNQTELLEHYEESAEWGLEEKEFDHAILNFRYCVDILPEPKTAFKESLRIYLQLGKSYLLNKEYQKAVDTFEIAKQCPNPDLKKIEEFIRQCSEEMN